MPKLYGFFLLACLLLATEPTVIHAQNYQSVRTSFADAVEAVGPAVVNIYSQKMVEERPRPPFFSDPIFQEFFSRNMPMRKRVERSLGSGMVVTPDGHIVTNLHVIEGASDIRVVFNDGREVAASYVGGDPQLDIAVLKIENNTSSLPTVNFVQPDSLHVGDVVLAIGNPFGVGQSVSLGVISALGRGSAALSVFSNYIQTDAAINPGNSGGALVTSDGMVAGMNTAIFSKTGASDGVGFAIPGHLVQAVLDDILTTGRVERPWFGATGQDVTASLAKTLGLNKPHGVLINDLAAGGPAEKAGVQVGDVLLSIDGKTIHDTRSFNAHIVSTPNLRNRRVQITVWRNGQEKTLSVRFSAMPPRDPADQVKLEGRHPLRGFVVEQLSPALNRKLDLPLNTTGVVIVDTPSQRPFGVTLRPGDVVREINGQSIENIDDIQQVLTRRARAWNITYQRDNRRIRLLVQ